MEMWGCNWTQSVQTEHTSLISPNLTVAFSSKKRGESSYKLGSSAFNVN